MNFKPCSVRCLHQDKSTSEITDFSQRTDITALSETFVPSSTSDVSDEQLSISFGRLSPWMLLHLRRQSDLRFLWIRFYKIRIKQCLSCNDPSYYTGLRLRKFSKFSRLDLVFRLLVTQQQRERKWLFAVNYRNISFSFDWLKHPAFSWFLMAVKSLFPPKILSSDGENVLVHPKFFTCNILQCNAPFDRWVKNSNWTQVFSQLAARQKPVVFQLPTLGSQIMDH